MRAVHILVAVHVFVWAWLGLEMPGNAAMAASAALLGIAISQGQMVYSALGFPKVGTGAARLLNVALIASTTAAAILVLDHFTPRPEPKAQFSFGSEWTDRDYKNWLFFPGTSN